MSDVDSQRLAVNVPAPSAVLNLVEQFARNESVYMTDAYVEASVRQEFLDPLFIALGWDVGNKNGWADQNKEVVVESLLAVQGARTAPDYAFRVGPATKFYAEAKRPKRNLLRDREAALQIRKYGWNKKLPLCILTDFEEFAVYDTQVPPNPDDPVAKARVDYFTYREYDDRWEWLEEQFGRDAVWRGSLEKYVRESPNRRGTLPVDDAFLRVMDEARESLAYEINKNNAKLAPADLSMAVQAIIDRIVFLRICEDRGTETYGSLKTSLKTRNPYSLLVNMFRAADLKYNSGLFHFDDEKARDGAPDRLTPRLKIGKAVLEGIILALYPPESPFDFKLIGVQILGQVYEQYLGSVITAQPGGKITVEAKPEVKKAGGVVYTPVGVVNYILDHSLKPLLESSTIDDVTGKRRVKDAHPLRVLDPACGSGSFLIAVYDTLLNWYAAAYGQDAAKWAKTRNAPIRPAGEGAWQLTTAERKRILLAHVFGVDIDPQAVEVTKLSLLLKVLEGETQETIDNQLALFQDRALPDLDGNIRCGNSLIESDYIDVEPTLNDDDARRARINIFDWKDEFKPVFSGPKPGFDVVLGNPPYVLLQDEFRDDLQLDYFRERYEVASYKLDLYHLFIEKGVELTRSGGYFSFITPSNYLTNNYLADLRRYLLKNSGINHIAVIDSSVFPRRSVDTAVFVIRPRQASAQPFRVLHADPSSNENLSVTTEGEVDPARALSTDHALFTGTAGLELAGAFDRMLAENRKLSAIASVNFGKQLRDRKKFPADVFVLKPKQAIPRRYAACYTGRDVTRWSLVWNDLVCLNDREAQTGGCWNPKMQDSKNKLLTRQIGRSPQFAIDTHGRQCLNTMFMVNILDSSVDPYFLLGVLNSTPVLALWIDRFFDQRTTFPKIKGTYLKELPVPRCASKEAAQIGDFAKRLISLTTKLGAASTESQRASVTRALDAEERRLDAAVATAFAISQDELEAMRSLVAAD